jgi:hypothetical protein
MGDCCGGKAPPGIFAAPFAGSMRLMNSSKREPVASRILAIDSVDGQRIRPSGDKRFDLLNAVGSRPARRASPDGVSLLASAKASIAPHMVW